MNFSVLWDPVCELIRYIWKVWHLYLLDELFHSSSYACSELKPLFWEVFGEALVTASKATPIG